MLYLRIGIQSIIIFLIVWSGDSRAAKPDQAIKYYNMASKARFYYHNGEYINAINLYKSAFKIQAKPLFQDEFCVSICYSKLNKYSESTLWLSKSIKNSPTMYFYTEYFKFKSDSLIINDTLFSFLLRDKIRYQLIAQCCKKQVETIKNNATLKKSYVAATYFYINDMYYSETNNKSKALEIYSKFIDTSLGSRGALEDSLVNYLLSNNKYISVNVFGNETFFSAVLHLDDQKLRKIFPILESGFIGMEISPYVYGAFLERLNWNINKENCQGYYIMHSSGCEKEVVIKNRKKIGLGIYLSEDDYSLNTFSKLYRIRKSLFYTQ